MKFLVLSLSLTVFCPDLLAQSFYLKFAGGYSFPLASHPLGKNDSDIFLRETDPETGYYIPSVQRSEEEVSGSHNSGASFSATVGCTLSSYMGVEVNMGYVYGKTYEMTSKSKELLDKEVQYEGKTTESWHSTNAFIAPALVLTAGDGTLKPYLTAGPVFAFAGVEEKFMHHSDFDVNPVPTVRHDNYSGGVAIGARGTAGLDFQLNERLRLFSEIAFTDMSYYPKEKEVVRYEIDGENQLPTLSIQDKTITFVKDTAYDTRSAPSSPDEPQEALRTSFGMSSLTATAGLKILL